LYGAGTSNNYLGGSLGIGSTSWTAITLNVAKNITGALTAHGIIQSGTIQTDVTAAGYGFRNILNTAASLSLTAYTHFRLGQSTIGAGTTIGTHTGIEVLDLSTGSTVYGITSAISSGASRWNLYLQGTAQNYINGSLLIGSTSNSGEKLQVTGTAKITGASSFGGNMTLSLNQNANTKIEVSNTTSGTSSASIFAARSTSGTAELSKNSATTTPYKIAGASDGNLYNSTGDLNILNDTPSGNIKFAAGGSSTAQWTIGSNGDLTAADGENIIVGTTTGTKIGTATSQKIGFWNATPIVQPTTAVAEAAFVENSGGTAVNVDSTFDGYTMQQVVKALRNAGLLA
jgi:hypothetical protein